MRRRPKKWVESHRVRHGPNRTKNSDGCTGVFKIGAMTIAASDGSAWPEELGPVPWEHVSVSMLTRTPSWREMDDVKHAFWKTDEAVMQLHRGYPVASSAKTLHLWRPAGGSTTHPRPRIPIPPRASRAKFDE
jgi:hypothetical protein